MPVLQDGELVLYGFVGDSYWDEGFTAKDVLQALSEVGRATDIIVRINSAGGYVDDGVAIYNALIAHKGKVTVQIDALAASAASIIAMAGDERVMRAGSLMMIHDPASYTFGNADEHEKSKSRLDKLGDQMAGIYADRTGEDEARLRSDMREEIWMTGEEAVERGFATSTESKKAVAFSAFDFRLYAHAPEKLKRLASKNAWEFEAKSPAVASAPAQPPVKDELMSDKPKADAVTAQITAARVEATQRIKTIMTSDAAKGREGQAEHLAYSTEISANDAVEILNKGPLATQDDERQAENNSDPVAYELQRLQASGLSTPQPRSRPQASLNRNDIYAARRSHMKGA